jgi:hypothetical protein
MTCVYRLYDCLGRLLYVGVAYDFDVRFRQHEAKKKWWPLVAYRDVIWFNNRLDALYEESRAIRTESPLHNERPGIHPVGLAVVPRKRSRYETRYAHVDDGELIVSSYDKEQIVREVVLGREQAVLAIEGEPLGVIVDLDWYRRAREAVGLLPFEQDETMRRMDLEEIVG